MPYVEVDQAVAEAFFDAGGTIYAQPRGYSLGVFREINNRGFRSVRHGLKVHREDLSGQGTKLGKLLLLVKSDDPHPGNPVSQDGNTFTIASP